MKPEIDYTLYLVTDRALMRSPTIEECVEQAISGGCTVVQLREKMASSREFYEMACKVSAVTTRLRVPLIINDRIDIALAVDAQGVHIGQEDIPAERARQLIGPNKTLGVSASNLEEALLARDMGADYLGVGAMFQTGTKTDAQLTSMEELRRIREQVALPLVVIGGINKETIPAFHGTGVDGLAVVSAIVSQKDVAAAARDLKALFQGGRAGS
ncbi:thiamine phosphate synthase [Christensenellaceae bacterium OttesenSCG-928-M15]|nr:thiamine phosphate synthase [Christensenellaceae bacterium OttesenSCG-928-M15]